LWKFKKKELLSTSSSTFEEHSQPVDRSVGADLIDQNERCVAETKVRVKIPWRLVENLGGFSNLYNKE